ncbi:hypothetical protein HN011_004043 [Eciton burchellii]|nr:hypothetical protein HN011_004043 [Eciton burchellii]
MRYPGARITLRQFGNETSINTSAALFVLKSKHDIGRALLSANERNEIEAFPKRSSKRLDSCEITVRYAIPERIPIAGHVAANDLTTAWHAMGVDAAGDSKMKM